MTEKKLEYFKNKLLKMRDEILQNIIDETADEENPFEIDGDLVDRAEALTMVAISEGLSSNHRDILENVQQALQKIKDGNYGVCAVSGEPIEEDRLEAIPYTDKCKKHMNDRPVYK